MDYIGAALASTSSVRHGSASAAPVALARAVAAKIDENPLLIAVARDNLERWKRQRPSRLLRCHREWEELLEHLTWKEIRRILTEDTEDHRRLRISSPFTGILSEQERKAVYETL